MKQWRCSQSFRHKRGAGGIAGIFCLLFFVFCLSGCGTGIEQKPQNRFIPSEGVLPPQEELEPLSEADVFGEYQGNMSVLMDGKTYGPYTETVKIRKKPSGDIFFRSERTSYKGTMPMDIGYRFEKTTNTPRSAITLTPKGKAFTFTGKEAWMMYYFWKDPPNSLPTKEGTSKTSVSGFIYKKAGMVYINFTVTYDTEATREAFPTIPEGTHTSMSSTMKEGTKK